MKTYNGKTISKKHIVSVLRTENPTEIFRLVHIIFGGKVEKSNVYSIIEQYAPTIRISRQAYNLAYGCAHARQAEPAWRAHRTMEYERENKKHVVMEYFREQLKAPVGAYTKRPMMGRTNLYFCSPVYGHSDYNKWCAMPIKGNERFCELLCRLADKYIPCGK